MQCITLAVPVITAQHIQHILCCVFKQYNYIAKEMQL